MPPACPHVEAAFNPALTAPEVGPWRSSPMPVVSRDSVHVLPSLSDYGRALWRHKAIIATALLIGALAGLFALPHLASAPEYQVTQRVDGCDDRLERKSFIAGIVVERHLKLDPFQVPPHLVACHSVEIRCERTLR